MVSKKYSRYILSTIFNSLILNIKIDRRRAGCFNPMFANFCLLKVLERKAMK